MLMSPKRKSMDYCIYMVQESVQSTVCELSNYDNGSKKLNKRWVNEKESSL